MRYNYSKWDDSLISQMVLEHGLDQLFNHLLLQANGDVSHVLSMMHYLQQQGYIDQKIDLDKFQKSLEEKNIIINRRTDLKLSSKGERIIREKSLDYIFSKLKTSGKGLHPIPREGGGFGEILPERRKFQFGDSNHFIDYNESVKQSIKRVGLGDFDLQESDLMIKEMEENTNAATVLLLDISHSMILYGEDRITPAKQVAMALAEMIKTRYPKDSLDVAVFGDEAKLITIKDLPYTGVGPYHTNTQAGLRLGRETLLKRKSANRQIFMITDGKPTVITKTNGEIYKNSFGFDPYIENLTLNEALFCKKKNISITTFMITSDPYLRLFIEKLTELNMGKAYYTPLNRLGGFIFQDFMNNRRKKPR